MKSSHLYDTLRRLRWLEITFGIFVLLFMVSVANAVRVAYGAKLWGMP